MVTIFIFNRITLQTSHSLKGEQKLGDMLRAREAIARPVVYINKVRCCRDITLAGTHERIVLQ